MHSAQHYFDLSHFGLIKVSGSDAEIFLQNQVTADIHDLAQKPWQMAAWCNPKGRILTNFFLFKSQTDHHPIAFFMLLPQMLIEQTINRLKRFVLRSNVSIENTNADHILLGLYGHDLQSIYSDTTIIKEIEFNEAIRRVILIVNHEQFNTVMNRITLTCKKSDRHHWSLLDIEGGIPWVTPQTTELFIPQMLNMDKTSGISFSKGCYPGQEIIARIHYRGDVKRRLYWLEGKTETVPGPGDALENENEKRAGEIVAAEPWHEMKFKALAVLETGMAKDEIKLRNQPGIQLEIKPV